jgi:MarR family 2-MHQ and catechol resistance regulon transcriptional repressor
MDSETGVALKLWVVMNKALRSVEEHLRRQVESHGLSFTEFAVLEVLLHRGALPIGELGGRILLTSGSMTYVVDKLEKRGLIRRRACPNDRRVIYAELTDEGRSLIEPVFQEHATLIRNLMDGITPEQQQTVTELLKQLGRYAEALDPQEALENAE